MGVLWPPSHFPCSLPWPRPQCPTRVCPARLRLKGLGVGDGEKEESVEEGKKRCGFG